MMMFHVNITQRIRKPLQAADVMVHSYPWAPDILAISNCIAEEAGDPPASELMSTGYRAAVGLPLEQDGQPLPNPSDENVLTA